MQLDGQKLSEIIFDQDQRISGRLKEALEHRTTKD